ncbi:MAG: NAD(P)/FAD-dependent oxidoreductase, partial [Hyphomicrobiaceae bacterium]
MSDVLPRHANVVIIGAGAIGCSIAWALARRGVSDIVVLEKSAITHGSTWHAAGLVGQYRNQNDLTRLMQLSVQLYCEMASETQIDWKQVGSLRLASSAERWHELEESALRAREQDVEFELISAGAARELFPNLNVAGVHGAAFVSGDGYVDPSSLTQEYAKRARSLGVRFVEDCLVNSIERNGDRLTAANTEHGRIETRSLVLAAGVWARQLGRSFDFDIPVCAVEHQYVVTEKSSKIHPDLPALRDPDLGFYVKPDVGALAIGGWEAGSCLASHGNVPFDFGRELYAGDLERLSSILEAAGR